MSDRPDWQVEGRDWPHRAASRFVQAGGVRWHVQVLGSGPAVLLLHGTGAATHSWRGLLPLLAERFTVIAPDLPGHGFSDPAPAHQRSLPAVARGIFALLQALGLSPAIAVGHSAGAAIAARMVLDGTISPQAVISLNGALLPLRGMPPALFIPAARLLSHLPLVPRFVAAAASDRSAVERLIRETGSRLDAEGIALYARLVRHPGHIAGILGMMANWDLRPLAHALPHLACRLLLVASRGDRTVPVAEAQRVHALVPSSSLVVLPSLGHLAHEEAPAAHAELIADAFESPVPTPPIGIAA